MRTRFLLAAPFAFALAACSSANPTNQGGGGSTSSSTSTGSGGAVVAESCTATFRWLQKDAYKDTAGRTSALWPPHTTTTLDVTCQKEGGAAEVLANAVMANHGTTPDAKDASGAIILQEMKREDVAASREALLDLVAKYEACSCEATTKFLSMDSLKDAAVQTLVQNVIAYLQQHMTCSSAGGTPALTDALQAGDFTTVLTNLPTCTWDSGSDLATGLDDALSTFLATTQEVLDGYHVCNNDAKLQAALWAGFTASKTATACDSDVPTCKGPAWFYTP